LSKEGWTATGWQNKIAAPNEMEFRFLGHRIMPIVRATTERRFNPHVCLFLPAVRHHLTTAKEKKPGCKFDWLAVIVLSALSLEAIGNSYGEVLIPSWKDFESASPIAKLRLVADKCGIKPDFNKHPWETARRLIKFRNLIAHAKRKHFKEERDCDENNYGEVFAVRFEDNIEKMITEDFAEQSCDAIEQIIKTLNKTLNDDDRFELNSRGHESGAQILAT
jgi:hypothetical protein